MTAAMNTPNVHADLHFREQGDGTVHFWAASATVDGRRAARGHQGYSRLMFEVLRDNAELTDSGYRHVPGPPIDEEAWIRCGLIVLTDEASA